MLINILTDEEEDDLSKKIFSAIVSMKESAVKEIVRLIADLLSEARAPFSKNEEERLEKYIAVLNGLVCKLIA